MSEGVLKKGVSLRAARGISRLEFLSTFDDSELEAILLEKKTNVKVELFWERLKMADTVKIADSHIKVGLEEIKGKGLISQEKLDKAIKADKKKIAAK